MPDVGNTRSAVTFSFKIMKIGPNSIISENDQLTAKYSVLSQNKQTKKALCFVLFCLGGLLARVNYLCLVTVSAFDPETLKTTTQTWALAIIWIEQSRKNWYKWQTVSGKKRVKCR